MALQKEEELLFRELGGHRRLAIYGSQNWAVPSTPHPAADGNRAVRLNVEYQTAIKAWQALPWLKRMRTPKPEPPIGV
jgi:hypothetical protein